MTDKKQYPPFQQGNLFDQIIVKPSALARKKDPPTSKLAAQNVVRRAKSQAARLLIVYAECCDGLTDDEAADKSGLLTKIGACWWRRCSDLRQNQLITPVGTRVSRLTNEERMVCVITDAGRKLVELWNER